MGRVLVDCRHAVRGLTRAPAYALSVMATLALAIGACTAIFSAVHAVLLGPTGIHQPQRLVVGWGVDPARGGGLIELTYLDIDDLAREARSFAGIASVASHTWQGVLDGQRDPERVSYAGVSGRFFEVLGVTPRLGRVLAPGDDVPKAEPVAVLSHAAWVRRYGADPTVIGRVLQVDGESLRIVGVAPEGFDYPRGAEFWVPLVPGLSAASAQWKTDVLRNVGILYLVGRVGNGVSVESAAAELSRVAVELQRSHASPRIGQRVVLEPWLDHVLGPTRPALWALLAAVAVLLVIACLNISGLMLTRVARSARDRAVRQALGAGGGDLIRPWLAETLVLSVAGGLAGFALAHWMARAMTAMAPDGIPRLEQVALTWPVGVFATAVVGAAAVASGIGPATLARRTNAWPVLASGHPAVGVSRSLSVRSASLVVQVALAVTLLVMAGLVVRSVEALRRLDLGFDPGRVVSLQIEPRTPGRPVNEWMRDLLVRVAARPGVEAAGSVFLRPLALGPIGQGAAVVLEGQPDTAEAADRNPILNYQVATPDYFRAMRVPLRAGRVFTDSDSATAPRVVIVGESTARRLWPGQDPIGRRVAMSSFTTGERGRVWRTVVGVVADVRYRGIDELSLDIYDPAAQSPMAATTLVVRTSADPLGLVAAIQSDARALDSQALVSEVATMESVVGRAMAPWRFTMWVFGLFAALALLLALVGLFSLVSLEVAHRQREFAIRAALGARGLEVAGAVARRVVIRSAVGIVAGLTLALGGSRLLGGLLVGVRPVDPVTYAAITVGVTVVVLVATWLPIRRAQASDPATLLRQ